ncbi:cell envelope integrity protein TolA [Gammaproteobacteria bacterium]|nr:cell envelope integrity protein TolA [Gammaproteobacteria bacterium]
MARGTASYNIYFFGFVFALGIHLGVGFLLSLSKQSPHPSLTGKQDYYIKAELYPVADLKNKKENSTKKEDEREKEKALQASQLEATSVKAEQKKIEKQIVSAQQVISNATETTESLRATRGKTGNNKMPTDFLFDLDRALLIEERLWEAKTEREKVLAYVANIQDQIVRKWSRPPTARNGMRCLLRVVLLPTGEVLQAIVEESSGNDAFDTSAVRAVFRASNLPVPEDNYLFEKSFREFTLLFRPDDLRL